MLACLLLFSEICFLNIDLFVTICFIYVLNSKNISISLIVFVMHLYKYQHTLYFVTFWLRHKNKEVSVLCMEAETLAIVHIRQQDFSEADYGLWECT